MSSIKNLPDYIHVARLKNIFWNNNSDLYPNNYPTIDLYTKITKTRPVFLSPFNGIVVLEGDFNHAFYNNKYYKLIKIKVIDIPRNRYEYQLEEDVMMNLLYNGAEIKGVLNRTNNPEILEECIHTTQPILHTPAKLTVSLFQEVKASWKETAKFIPYEAEKIGLNVFEKYISNKDWHNFKERIKVNLYIKAIRDGKKWTLNKKAGSQAHSANPLFIIDRLAPTYYFSWKALVLGKVADFCKKWEGKKLSKVSIFSNSFLKGNSCITYEDATFSIGASKEEQLELLDVDLSGLTDVVLLNENGTPIDETNPSSPYYREPDKSKDLLPDGIGEGGTEEMEYGWYLKLCRNPHLPIKRNETSITEVDKWRYIPADSKSNPTFKLYEETNYTGSEPQELTFKDENIFSKKGWLWHINRIDFPLITGFGDTEKDNPTFDPFRKLSYIDDKKAKNAGQYFFRKLDRKDIPPIGFLIYQLRQQRGLWDDYEYLGENNPKQFQYRSGLTKTLFETYQKTDQWWSTAPSFLQTINGIPELSKMTLDIDLFNWLLFAPSRKDYLWKEFYDEYYSHFRYFPGRSPWYSYDFTNWDIEGNGKHLTNPLTKDRIGAFLSYREKTIDGISFYDNISFDKPIKQNDVFCSDLEYVWKTTPFLIKEIPIDIDTDFLKGVMDWIPKAVVPATAASLPTTFIAGYLSYVSALTAKTSAGLSLGTKIVAKPILHLASIFKTPQVLSQYSSFLIKGKFHKLPSYLRTIKKLKDLGSLKRAATALRAMTGALRTGAALKSLGTTLAIELLIWGVFAAYDSLQPDVENRLMNSIWTMGDFFGGEKIDVSGLQGNMVVYLNKGTFKVGAFNHIQKDLSLTDNENQIVKTVDGKTTRTTFFTHIEKLFDLDVKGETLLTEVRERELFKTTYKAFRGTSKSIFIHEEDLTEPNNKILFDLVGTKWYAQFWKGKVNLIAKDLSPFAEKEHVNTREIKFEEGVKPSIYARINQKSDLVIYSTILPLNTKYSFDQDKERDLKHFLRVRPMRKELEKLHQGSTDNLRDYWHVEYRTPFDYINTYVSVFSIKGTIIKEIPFGEYERLKLQKTQHEEMYWIGSQQNKNLIETRKLHSSRLHEDLDNEYTKKAYGIGERAAMGIIKGGAHGAAVGGVKGGLKGALVGGLIGAAAGGLELFRFSKESPMLKERINEDDINFMRDNHLSEYARKQNYEFKKSENLINLNSLTNTYIKPTSTDDDVQRAMNAMNYWDDMHIKIYLPTSKQEEIIKKIYDEFGCYCRSEWYVDKPLIIRNYMDGGIFQFSNLEPASIVSAYTTDIQMGEIVRNIFLSGTKFIDFKHEAMQEETHVFIVPKGTEIDFDTSKMQDWDDRLWEKYFITKPKSEILKIIKNQKNYGLTDEEYNANKAQLEGASDDELYEKIRQITTNRETGTHFVLPPPTDESKDIIENVLLKKKVEELEGNIAKLNADITKLQGEIEGRKLSSHIAANKITDLERQLKITKEELEQAHADYLRCENVEKKDLEGKIRKIEGVEIPSLQGQLAKAKEEIKKLEEQKKLLETITIPNLQSELRRYKEEKIPALEQELKELKDKKIPGYEKSKEDMEKVNKAQKDKINSLEAELIRLKETKIPELEKKIKELEKRECPPDKSAELEVEKGSVKALLALSKVQCMTIRELALTDYDMDLKERGDGGNALRDLVTEMLLELKWLRASRTDALLGHRYKEMQKVIDYLYKFQEIPLVAKWEEVMDMPGWKDYKTYIQQGGSKNGEVDKVIQAVNDIRTNYENVAAAHGIKALLDKLNSLSFGAQMALQEQLKNDIDLQYMFTHVYPGRILSFYQKLYGDPNVALRKYLLMNTDFDCSGITPENATERLKKYLTIGLSSYGIKPSGADEIDRWTHTPLPPVQPDRKEGFDVNPILSPKGSTIPLSTRQEDITLFFTPKYIPENFDQAQGEYIYPATDLKDWKSCYWLYNEYYSWKYFKSAYSKNRRSAEYGLYFSTQSSTLFSEIIEDRRFVWKNYREKARSLMTKPVSEYDWDRYVVFKYWDSTGVLKEYERKINLLDIFGPFYVFDAAFLFGILSELFVSYNKGKDSSGYTTIEFRFLSKRRPKDHIEKKPYLSRVSDNNFTFMDSILVPKDLEKEWKTRRTIYCVFEFNSLVSLLNYIWRHIKLNIKELENTYDTTYAKTGLDSFVRMIKGEMDKCS